jgi:hypothetical protein
MAADDKDLARVCYEASRAYSGTFGDHSMPSWDICPPSAQALYTRTVGRIRATLGISPEAVHDLWRADMTEQGWRMGGMRAPDVLEHPGLIEYGALTAWRKAKTRLFIAIVRALDGEVKAVEVTQAAPMAIPVSVLPEQAPAQESPRGKRGAKKSES